MKNFSQILKEERKNYDSISLIQSEISSYITKVKRILPKQIQDIIRMTEKYGLNSSKDIDAIRFANKSQLETLADKFNIPLEQIQYLFALLKQNNRNIRMLPQFQSFAERAAIEAGKLTLSDLTIDLDSQTGRNAAAKIYMPIVLKIASQYIGKSRLDKPSLISAGMEGMVNAMKDWGKNTADGGKKTTFRTYVSYRIQQAILNEINSTGHTLSGTNWYATSKYGASVLDALSLDGLTGNDDEGDFKQDHLIGLGVDPTDPDRSVEKDEEIWKEAFKTLEDKFSTRDMDIFYRYFGLGPYHGKRQKTKDIAKEYNMSAGNIRNSIINKILKFLQTNPKASQIMAGIKELYTESLMLDMIYMDNKEQIREAFYRDTTYILLEEITRWDNKQTLVHAVNAACDRMDISDAKFIYDILTKGTDFFKKHYKSHKKLIIHFLSDLYPVDNMMNKTEDDIYDYIEEIVNASQAMNIDW